MTASGTEDGLGSVSVEAVLEDGLGSVSVEAVLEVLAYLVSATRTQLDEAAEYAPMRLLTAAQRLAAAIPEDAPPPVLELAAALRDVPPTATPTADPVAYVAMVDGLCAELADCLLAVDPTMQGGGTGP